MQSNEKKKDESGLKIIDEVFNHNAPETTLRYIGEKKS